MEDWLVISSKSVKEQEFGFPIGEILCRDPKDIDKIIKKNNIHDPVVTKYCELKE